MKPEHVDRYFSTACDGFATGATFTTKVHVGVSFVYNMNDDVPEVDSFSRKGYQAHS